MDEADSELRATTSRSESELRGTGQLRAGRALDRVGSLSAGDLRQRVATSVSACAKRRCYCLCGAPVSELGCVTVLLAQAGSLVCDEVCDRSLGLLPLQRDHIRHGSSREIDSPDQVMASKSQICRVMLSLEKGDLFSVPHQRQSGMWRSTVGLGTGVFLFPAALC